MQHQNQARHLAPRHSHVVIAIAILVAMWLVAPFALIPALMSFSVKPSIEHVGILGDAFGAINALFTVIAFAAVVISIWLQHKALEQQHDEMAQSTAALNERNEIERTLVRQRLTVDLFNEWNESGFLLDRAKAKKTMLTRDEDSSVFWVNLLRVNGIYSPLERITSFLSKAHRLARYQIIDGEMICDLLVGDIHEWLQLAVLPISKHGSEANLAYAARCHLLYEDWKVLLQSQNRWDDDMSSMQIQ